MWPRFKRSLSVCIENVELRIIQPSIPNTLNIINWKLQSHSLSKSGKRRVQLYAGQFVIRDTKGQQNGSLQKNDLNKLWYLQQHQPPGLNPDLGHPFRRLIHSVTYQNCLTHWKFWNGTHQTKWSMFVITLRVLARGWRNLCNDDNTENIPSDSLQPNRSSVMCHRFDTWILSGQIQRRVQSCMFGWSELREFQLEKQSEIVWLILECSTGLLRFVRRMSAFPGNFTHVDHGHKTPARFFKMDPNRL